MCIVEESGEVVNSNKTHNNNNNNNNSHDLQFPVNASVDGSSLTNVLRSEGQILIGMVAVQSTTGDIIFDTFQDNALRDELGTFIVHIRSLFIDLFASESVSVQERVCVCVSERQLM
jgi:hypothetical protein